MGKRRMSTRRSTAVTCKNEVSSDSELDYSDSENDFNYNTGKKIRFDSTSYYKSAGKSFKLSPKEDNEHTYSCIPIFNNIGKNDENSSESDCEKSSSSRRISERSTSFESTKSVTGNSKRYQPKRTPKCFTKNAVMARQNRQKKKEYVEGLEGDLKCLKKCNDKLKLEVDEQRGEISALKNQIQYLRSALMNSKEIGMLIKRVCNNKMDLKVTSSLLQTPPVSERETNSPIANCYEGTNVALSDNVSDLGYSSPEFSWCDDFNNANFQTPTVSERETNFPIDNCNESTNVALSNNVSSVGYSSPEFNWCDDFNNEMYSEYLNSDYGRKSTDLPSNDLPNSTALINDPFSNYTDAGEVDWPLINGNETMDIENLLQGSDEPPFFDFADFSTAQSFGVCLHVANKQVSLEFCDSCNRSALQGCE